MKFKKGDIVGRKSYNKDIIFIIERIIKIPKGESIAILKGVTIRIEADSRIEDLELIDKDVLQKNVRSLDTKLNNRINDKKKYINFKEKMLYRNTSRKFIYTGRILHLDGDKKYTEKSYRYYKRLGLNAIVRNIRENNQPKVIEMLLNKYNPDILIITGHDGMIKNGREYTNIYNYRNSRYFIKTVTLARKWERKNSKNLVIFAGACQSYFEAIINAGANFASSPGRVLIDFSDPLIIAEKVATTEEYKYLDIKDIASELRDGLKGIGGIGANGKKKIIVLN